MIWVCSRDMPSSFTCTPSVPWAFHLIYLFCFRIRSVSHSLMFSHDQAVEQDSSMCRSWLLSMSFGICTDSNTDFNRITRQQIIPNQQASFSPTCIFRTSLLEPACFKNAFKLNGQRWRWAVRPIIEKTSDLRRQRMEGIERREGGQCPPR